MAQGQNLTPVWEGTKRLARDGRPVECLKCFSERLAVDRHWSGWNCHCLDCDNRWTEQFPDSTTLYRNVGLRR